MTTFAAAYIHSAAWTARDLAAIATHGLRETDRDALRLTLELCGLSGSALEQALSTAVEQIVAAAAE